MFLADSDSLLTGFFHRKFALVLEEPKPVLSGDLLVRGAGHDVSLPLSSSVNHLQSDGLARSSSTACRTLSIPSSSQFQLANR